MAKFLKDFAAHF